MSSHSYSCSHIMPNCRYSHSMLSCSYSHSMPSCSYSHIIPIIVVTHALCVVEHSTVLKSHQRFVTFNRARLHYWIDNRRVYHTLNNQPQITHEYDRSVCLHSNYARNEQDNIGSSKGSNVIMLCPYDIVDAMNITNASFNFCNTNCVHCHYW